MGHRGLPELLELARGRSRLRRVELIVHLNFGERSVEPEMREQAPGDRDELLTESISATLESIRRQIEKGAGKVEPPPSAETEPPTG